MRLFVLGSLMFLFEWNVNAATIHIKNLAEIAGANITLGEIAQISASSPQEEAQFSHLTLGAFPKDEIVLTLSASQISERLRQHLEILKNSQVKLPEKIEIKRKEQVITSSKVKGQIEKVVRSFLPDSSWEYQISDVNLAPVISQIKAAGFSIIPPLARPRGVFSFELIATEHNMPLRFWVTAKVQYFCKVATLVRQINVHSRFAPSDFEWQRKDITFINDVPATSTDTTVSLARVTLSPGTILLRSHLEREMALKFGDQVDLVLGDDGLAIMTKGIAQQNGYIGDSVKVKSVETNRVLDGIITARGVVNVRY